MRPGQQELRWAYLLFALLALDSFLVAWQVPRPLAFWVLLPLLAVQLIAAWLAPRVVRMVRGHRQLQESYAEELAFARQLMESVEHGLTVTDEDGRFVYVNRAYARLLGTVPDKVLGRTPFDFTLPEDHAQLLAAQAERLGGQSSSYRTRLRHHSGAAVEVVVTGTPRWHGGRIVGNVAAVVPLHELDQN
ncbi:PAS domain S-box protein [Deinococcus sp. HMF7604]|uniref:PAS domain S-box protein n=1 Tax=Deinococcus betulae TaxID=2873312 RepID=UPI001CCE5E56|nr:PAS domain S-box protein [Deinococcus betulae]MBZ9752052.1 PAS domain S-box protein [Deinococcus betulae]